MGAERRDEGAEREVHSLDGRRPSGSFPVGAGALNTDLWFWWEGDPRDLEVLLVTVNGNIAGAFPMRVARGERLPIHRRFVPRSGDATWFVRVSPGDVALHDLTVAVEVRDQRGRTSSSVVCDREQLPALRVASLERTIRVPDELLA
jgi:hypothetical protein